MAKSALSGISVIEYADFISGPCCSKLMADLGATVIKVEEPQYPDSSRLYGPFAGSAPDPEASGLLLYLNTNKMGVTLNLHTGAGRSIFKELITRADIFVTNYAARELKALGMSYGILRKANPDLIYTSITPFGLSGPRKDLKGNNLIAFHMGGMASFTPDWVEGRKKMPPLKAGGHQADFASGIAAAMSTLGALFGRLSGGKGSRVDISEQEVVAFALARSIAFYSYEGVRQDRRKQARSMEGSLPCKDGYVECHIVEDSHWQAFRQVIGNPEWVANPMFQTYADRCRNWKLFEKNVSAWTMQHTKQEIYHMMQAKRVAFGPVNTAEDVLQSAQISQRHYFVDVEHSRAGKLKYPGAPFKLSATPHEPPRPAPLLGEHSAQVYGEMLGITEKRLEELRASGTM